MLSDINIVTHRQLSSTISVFINMTQVDMPYLLDPVAVFSKDFRKSRPYIFETETKIQDLALWDLAFPLEIIWYNLKTYSAFLTLIFVTLLFYFTRKIFLLKVDVIFFSLLQFRQFHQAAILKRCLQFEWRKLHNIYTSYHVRAFDIG